MNELDKMQTLTESLEEMIPHSVDEDLDKIFDNPAEFEMAVGRATLDNTDHLLVTPKLMKYILKGRADQSVVYRGIRLYTSKAAKKQLDREERLNAEDYLAYISKK